MHESVDDELNKFHEKRGQKIGKVAPRGGAKTTRITKGYSIYCACEGLEPFIGIIKDTYGQAVEDVQAIKNELETNEQIAEWYPHVFGKGSEWSDDRIVTRNGVCIQAFGRGSKIRGRTYGPNRFTLLIFDDLDNDELVLSGKQRRKTWNWLTRAAIPAGSKNTNMLFVGTAQHRDDTLQRLKLTPGWDVETFQSIISWPKNMKLWDKWEEFYNDVLNPERLDDARAFFSRNQAAMILGADVLWPESEDLYDLMCLRATIGSLAFDAEKQGKPTSVNANEWPDSYFDHDSFWFESWPKTQVRVQALDPSKGANDKADYQALCSLGLGNDGVLYVEADLQRRDISKLTADCVDSYQQFGPAAFGVEANGFQELLSGELEREANARNLTLPLFAIHNTINKKVRIRSLTPFLKQRRIRFRANNHGTALLVDQLREFPTGEHDDGPDSLEMAIRLLMKLFAGEETTSTFERVEA